MISSTIPEALRQSICEIHPQQCRCTFLHRLHGDQGPLALPAEILLHAFHQRIPVVLTVLLGIYYLCVHSE